jgi:hypothetical protein
LPAITTTMKTPQTIQAIGWETPSACAVIRSAPWRRVRVGGGCLVIAQDGLRLALAGARRGRYADAMISDYLGLARRRYPWRPPLRMTVRARASGPLVGTAGGGFWNNPLQPLGSGGLALPAAIWFFHASPPSDMPLAEGVPGQGWKVACLDATQPSALAWAPLAPPVLLLNNFAALRRRLWPRVQRALRCAEAPIGAPDTTWRIYTLEWRRDSAMFAVDGVTVLETDRSPRGPLGFVAWLDNQWAVVTPWGRFGAGLLDTPTQWLDLGMLRIERLA